MGKQIQIYLVPEDVTEFESALKSMAAVILKRSSPKTQPVISETARLQTTETVRIDGYIARICDLEHVSMRAIPEQAHWTVDALHSPVMEFFGCHFDGKTLKRGRLFYDQGFHDAAGVWIDKPKDFDAFAKNVFKLARKMFINDLNLHAYVGPKAREWQSESHGAFVSFPFVPSSKKSSAT
jgi:hypothetical protein